MRPSRTSHDSFCLPGDHAAEVEELLARLVLDEGFERVAGEPLLPDLDEQLEKGAFIVTNDRSTVIVWSDVFETERLAHELQALDVPLLHVWEQAPDLWGYEVVHRGDLVTAFCSNPRYRGREVMPDAEAGDEPALLATALGLEPAVAGEVTRIRRRKGAVTASACDELCSAIGIPAAATSYRAMARDEVPAAKLAGARVDRLHFILPGSNPLDDVDLHADSAWDTFGGEGSAAAAGPPGGGAGDAGAGAGAPAALAAALPVGRPLLLAALGWERLRSWLAGDKGVVAADAGPAAAVLRGDAGTPHPGQAPRFRVAGKKLVSDRHGLELALFSGVEPLAPELPADTVFAFRVLGRMVACRAIRPRWLRSQLRRGPGITVRGEEDYHVHGMKAKFVWREERKGGETLHSVAFFVERGPVIYVFADQDTEPVPDAAVRLLADVVDSLQPVG